MFPRGLLIFIIILVFDIISKSIRDKKKIEESRRKRQQSLVRDDDMAKKSFREVSNRQEMFPEEKLAEYTVAAEPKETGYFDDEKIIDKVHDETHVHKSKITDMTIKDKEVTKKKTKNKKKNDILRGIIFSEVLSEPKSLKNTKRSM